MKPVHRAGLLVCAAIIIAAALSWKCTRDPAFNFLPTNHRAEWILFPSPLAGNIHPVALMDTTFRRRFEIKAPPKSARLFLCGAKRVELKINEKPVEIGPSRNWKDVLSIEVSGLLAAGENTIEGRVFNDDAPPALWLALTTAQIALRTDETWEASLAGSAWRQAALASVPRKPGPGNFLSGGETTFGALSKIWPSWAAFAVIAFLLSIIGRRCFCGTTGFSPKLGIGLLGIGVLAWTVLFWNNVSLMPFHTGYDATDHLSYISYIQERRALPLPNEGFEMFQPPLYYALSAAALSIGRLSIADHAAVVVLRALTMIFGIANFTFAFLTLRLLFPFQIGAQISGFLVAAFLPMQLYLSHYVTNETLNAMLVSGCLYFAVRALVKENLRIREYVLLGVFVGGAMLAKTISLLLIPPLIGAFSIKLLRQRAAVGGWLRTIGATLLVAAVVCGWHYVRIWQRCGTPIVSNFGNWGPAYVLDFWQDPGFHTVADYFRLGRALIEPLYSGFNGFADGLYSTIWGDGLCGGFRLPLRPPWNYDLMAGGYLIALVPTILVVIGVVAVVDKFVRQPSPEWFLLLGYSAAITLALIFISLRVPSYSVIKGFYGLSALVPFSAFLATGWKTSPGSRPRMRPIIMTLLVFWALNSFASVWIYRSARQHIHVAMRSISEHRRDQAISETTAAIKSDPSNSRARCLLGSILDESGEWQEAVEEAENGIRLDPMNGDCHLLLAITLAKHGEMDKALDEGERALQLAPENPATYDLLFTILRELGHPNEAMTVARDALAISPFESDLHYRVGLAAGEMGDFATAAPQFAYALLLQPNHLNAVEKLDLSVVLAAKQSNAKQELAGIASAAPDFPPLLDKLAWLFSTTPDSALRNGAEAVRLAERACNLTKRTRPAFVATLAAAYAEAGRLGDGIATANEAIARAKSDGDVNAARLAERLLTSFQTQQPYRDASQP